MTMGDILAAARRSSGEVERHLLDADPVLAARVASAAADGGGSVGTLVRIAVADFSRFATEDDWATLVSRLRDDREPGMTCLVAMLEWRLPAAAPDESRPGPDGGSAR